MKQNTFADLLQRFFLDRLMNQMNASPRTIDSYRDTFRLFLNYAAKESNCPPGRLTLGTVGAELVVDFLHHLETERKNSVKTRNIRLAAIHSFMHYAAYQAPEHLSSIQRVLSIPFKKTESRIVEYLTLDEVEVILDACNLNTWLGRRDRVMISLLHNTGVRVSELVSIRKQDIQLERNRSSNVHVIGKGRKARTVPIWKTTAQCVGEFMKETEGPNLFTNKKGERLTRSGVAYRLTGMVSIASSVCPSLTAKRVTPHVFRHTTAMHLLQAGVDISTIALWLGHESIETTHKYMAADLRLKEQALALVNEPNAAEFTRYMPSEDVLAFLDSL